MSYESKIIATDKEHIYVVELELDYCQLTFGSGLCVGGVRSIVTTAVSTDDFTVGDEIEGATSGAIGIISAKTGSSPTYTFEYRSTNGIDFQTAAETITNNTATGSATKDGNAPTLITSGDDKCFNTFDNCQSLSNYTATSTNSGSITVSVNSTTGIFTRSSGSFITDGFLVDHVFTTSGFPESSGDNGTWTISAITATTITVTDNTGMSTRPGTSGVFVKLQATKTYRYCEPRSPHPIGIDAIPSLSSVNITPSKIGVAGGMGERSSVSLSFNDHLHSDIGVDKYIDDRTWDASQRGLYWTKLRARNPNYQFRNLRVLTGYLDNGVYTADNFKTRNYVIEKLDVTAGKASITGKDPLKLASTKKAQVPTPNTGILVAGINSSVTSATLTPTGVGALEYAASGSLVIESEVCTFTRSGDVLTLVRGASNTTAAAHSTGDTVQQCYVKNDEVNIIIEDILTNFATIDPLFINSTAWQTEIDTYLNGLLDGIITKPTDVNKVFKELAEAKPLFIYWDEINQTINLTALKAPPTAANLIDMDSGIVAGSFRTKDKPEMRASTVYVTFGQIDPTKPLTELSNYTQTVIRSDTDSITKYGSNQIKTFVSRWINSGNKPAAENAAQLYGRRFSDIPREVDFSLEAKDSALLIGNTRSINHRDMVDETGLPVDTVFQIISAKEDKAFKYKGIEYNYGQTITGDNDISTDTILISVDEQNLDLRARYESLIGIPTGSTEAIFQVESGVVVGSSTTGTDSIETGTWPVGATVLLINNGHIVGAGGDGGLAPFGGPFTVGSAGGDALNLTWDITIENNGVIGGGGGGGGANETTVILGTQGGLYGGGGAGNVVGLGFDSNSNGTLETGGFYSFRPDMAAGGDLGTAGDNSDDWNGGAAGKAIDENGFTATFTTTGIVHGTVS